MSEPFVLHVFEVDFPDGDARALLDWCVARGADVFTVDVVGSRPGVFAFSDALTKRLAPWRLLDSPVVPIPEGQPGAYWSRPTYVWRLVPQSAEQLWQALKGRLLGYDFAGDAWCENPALYRDGTLMLGVISHENEGVLRIQPREQVLLEQAEIPYRLKGEWAGY